MPSFHHGNLRAELLDRAEVVLRDRGVEQLSLRELARDAGVSHGAPRSHFIDRNALLNALAERGFDRLTEAIDTAAGSVSTGRGDAAALLRSACRAYLDFATDNPALLNLIVTAKADDVSGTVHAAAERLFTVTSTLVRTALGPRARETEEIERLTLLLSATIQGVSSTVSSGRISVEKGDALLHDAVRVFLSGTVSSTP
jgi:AcrR family transcriptional regulator